MEVEGGKEIGGQRSVDELLKVGYKMACPYIGPDEGEKVWKEYPTCIVEEPVPVKEEEPEPDPDEISAEEALNIITEGI